MTQRVATPDELARQAYAAAVRLLASRDHSIAELRIKLLKRNQDSEAIDAAIDQLTDANYLNDARFAQSYAEQRMAQGFGPLSIRAKLTARGIDGQLVQQALSSLPISWSEQAEQLIHNRFSVEDICESDKRVTARIARFLATRGFSSSDALRALTQARRDLNR